MTDERYWQIESGKNIKLTSEERKEGWHFCPDWDFLLIGPGMSELEGCLCNVPTPKGDSK